MGKSFRETVQYIKESVDIVQVIGRYVQLKDRNGQYWGLSPFKVEKTPSFCVDPHKKLFYCFSTSQGGDVFKFIEKVENVDFIGATKIIAKELGLEIEEKTNTAESFHQPEKTRLVDLCTRIDKMFHYFLMREEGAHAHNYIISRKIQDEYITKFHLGYAPKQANWLFNFLRKKGYTETEIKDSGLFSKNYPKYALFQDRLIFPILSVSGHTVGFGGRLLHGEGPKYLNSHETSIYKKKNTLYGLYQCIENDGFKKNKKAYLVEGYIDVIAMHQAGLHSTVAPLGTSFTLSQAETLRRYTDEIVLIYDNDSAGMRAAIKSAITCELVGFKMVKIALLSKKDPSDVLEEFGALELQEQILTQREFFYYYLQMLVSKSNSTQEKESAFQSVIEYISAIQSSYKKELYIAKATELFHVSSDFIYSELQTSLNNSRKRSHSYTESYAASNILTSDNASQTHIPIKKTGELLVLSAVCAKCITDEKIFEEFRSIVKLSDLFDMYARRVYQVLEDCYRAGSIDFEDVMNALDAQISDYIRKLIVSGEASQFADKIITDFYDQIKINRLRQRSKKIELQLRATIGTTEPHLSSSLASEGDIQEELDVEELLREKKFINNEIMKLQKKNKHHR